MDKSPLETHHHHQSSSSPPKDSGLANKVTLPATTDPPSASNPPKQKVWLVFGATGHMGRSLVKAALQHKDLVCAVGQSHVDSLASVQQIHRSSSNTTTTTTTTTKPASLLSLLCDVRVRDTVALTITQTITHFGRLDIIANCSGYGVIGACEDQDEYEIRNQFETNFMGTLNIIQLSLPYFRERGEGRYLIFSSTSGALGVPGLGPYCATKYAVEGLIESMLYEVDGFGIRATLVEPSHLRRDDVHQQQQQQQQPPPPPPSNDTPTITTTINNNSYIKGDPPPPQMPLYGHFRILRASPPYSTSDSPSKHAQRLLQWIGDHQPTSVVKAAELSWQLGHCSFPPLRLLLGTYAVESVRDRLKSVIEEIEDWKYLNYPAMPGMDEKEDGEEGERGGGDGEGDVDGLGDGDVAIEDDDEEEDEGQGEDSEAHAEAVERQREKQRRTSKGKAKVKHEIEDSGDVAMEDA